MGYIGNDNTTSAQAYSNATPYAVQWANKPEDQLVSALAGGDLIDDYSALHWANKAADSANSAAASANAAATSVASIGSDVIQSANNASNAATSASNAATSASNAATSASNASTSASNASTSASNASTSETNAAASAASASSSENQSANNATNASNSASYAQEWANKAEDSLVSSNAGGDQVDDYSALHWANKAAASALAAESAANTANKVTGPASATDNAFARFDSTTGKLIQNGQTTEDDSGNVTVAGDLTISGGDANLSNATGAATFGIDAPAVNVADLSFNSAGAGDWILRRDTVGDLVIYDYAAAAIVMRLNDNGDHSFSPPSGNFKTNNATGNAVLSVESTTDDAYVDIDSGKDGTSERSQLRFKDNGSTKWSIFKETNSSLVFYDFTATATAVRFNANGAINFTPTGEVQINGVRVLDSTDNTGFATDSRFVDESGTSRTLTSSDAGKFIYCGNVSGCTITANNGVFSVGDVISFGQEDTGQVILNAGTNVVIDKPSDLNLKSRVRRSVISLMCTSTGATDYFIAYGDLEIA